MDNPESKGVIKNGQSREQRGNQEWNNPEKAAKHGLSNPFN
jgi:hypothetical protein